MNRRRPSKTAPPARARSARPLGSPVLARHANAPLSRRYDAEPAVLVPGADEPDPAAVEEDRARPVVGIVEVLGRRSLPDQLAGRARELEDRVLLEPRRRVRMRRSGRVVGGPRGDVHVALGVDGRVVPVTRSSEPVGDRLVRPHESAGLRVVRPYLSLHERNVAVRRDADDHLAVGHGRARPGVDVVLGARRDLHERLPDRRAVAPAQLVQVAVRGVEVQHRVSRAVVLHVDARHDAERLTARGRPHEDVEARPQHVAGRLVDRVETAVVVADVDHTVERDGSCEPHGTRGHAVAGAGLESPLLLECGDPRRGQARVTGAAPVRQAAEALRPVAARGCDGDEDGQRYERTH